MPFLSLTINAGESVLIDGKYCRVVVQKVEPGRVVLGFETESRERPHILRAEVAERGQRGDYIRLYTTAPRIRDLAETIPVPGDYGTDDGTNVIRCVDVPSACEGQQRNLYGKFKVWNQQEFDCRV